MADESNFTNSIRPTKRPRKGKRPAREESLAQPRAAIGPTEPAVATKPKARNAIPDEIRQKFTQVGNRYHFKDGALAFTDRGDRIPSPSENTEVIKSLVSIAKEREWSDITVAGTERFRRDAWFAARIASLEVRGYEATEYDQARVARALARVEPTTNSDAARAPSNFNAARSIDWKIKTRRDPLDLGRLIDHGAPPYKH